MNIRKRFFACLMLMLFSTSSFTLSHQSACICSIISGVSVGLVSANLMYQLLSSADKKKLEDDLEMLDFSSEEGTDEEIESLRDKIRRFKNVFMSSVIGSTIGVVVIVLAHRTLFFLREVEDHKEAEKEKKEEYFRNFGEEDFQFDQELFKKAKASYILGISNNATRKEIREAYKKLARKWHPDRCSNRDSNSTEYKKYQERFKEIVGARDMLLPKKV